MVAKSNRSTLTLFHQWPNHSNSSNGHLSSSSSPTTPTTPISPALNPAASRKSILHPPTIVTPNTPDSPSQLDPFNNISTLPSPLISLPSRPTSRNSRPASQRVVSPSQPSRPGSIVGPLSPACSTSTAPTPRIVLASPSTSTIHYLFPSDTRSNVTASTDRAPRTNEKSTRSGSVRRSHSASTGQGRGERERERSHDREYSEGRARRHRDQERGENDRPTVTTRSHSDTRPLDLAVDRKIIDRSIPLPPSRSCDSIKHLSTGTLGIALGRPSKQTNPLGPAKRVVSGSSVPPSSTTPAPSGSRSTSGIRKSDISAPISVDPKAPAKSYGSMRTLRRQPSMADLGRGVARGLQVDVDEAQRSLGKSSSVGRAGGEGLGRVGVGLSEARGNRDYDDGMVSPRTLEPRPEEYDRAESSHILADPTRTTRQIRRRSQSLTSPRSPASPPSLSPVLPAPDFGNPLNLSDVIPSPSFSHLEYSTAGSTPTSARLSRRGSNAIGLFTKHASAIFPTSVLPTSVGMERGSTRRGLGSYDSGKIKAHEDAAKRLNGDGFARRMSILGRSMSMRKKDDGPRVRPRSQSLSTRSIRDVTASPPVPSLDVRHSPNKRDTIRAYTAELALDMGARFHTTDHGTRSFYPNSPKSTDTSLYPDTTPSEHCASLPPLGRIDGMENDLTEVRILGRPAFAGGFGASEISILAPSTLGLGFSPIGTGSRVSLPESLEMEAIDVTERGRKFSQVASPPAMPRGLRSPPPSAPGLEAVLADSERHKDAEKVGKEDAGETESTRPRSRASMLKQNTYYIPPVHPRPALRASKSAGPGTMRRAFASANLAEKEALPAIEGERNRKVDRPPSILSRRSRPNLREGSNTTNPTTNRAKRPTTAFSLCSPPDAIDPLPVPPGTHVPDTEPTRLRSKTSSPFLSASASLRVFFGRDGFVARSLSGAFDKDPTNEIDEKPGHGLKSRISAPIGVGQSHGTGTSRSARGEGHTAIEGTRNPEKVDEQTVDGQKAWREDVLAQALSLSISSSLHRLSALGTDDPLNGNAGMASGSERTHDTAKRGKMPSSSSRPRLGIPAELLAESPGGTGLGEMDGEDTPRAKRGKAVARSGGEGQDGREYREDSLSPLRGRTVGQVGREDSMGSASVYSRNAPTAFEPRSRETTPDSPGRYTYTHSRPSAPRQIEGKKDKHSKTPLPSSKLTISAPLPLFTPANPSRLGLAALAPRKSPEQTVGPFCSPAGTVCGDSRDDELEGKREMELEREQERLSGVTVIPPFGADDSRDVEKGMKVRSRSKVRLMSIIRRNPDQARHKDAKEAKDPMDAQEGREGKTGGNGKDHGPPTVTSPSTFSLSLLRSTKSVGSYGRAGSKSAISHEKETKNHAQPRGNHARLETAHADLAGEEVYAGLEVETEELPVLDVLHALGGAAGSRRGVLDELVARDEGAEVSLGDGVDDKERAREEKMRGVLVWRRGVGSDEEW